MQENGRQRAAKIDRHYYAKPDRFLRRKRWVGLLGLVVGFAYSLWLFSSSGAVHVTTGHLSQPHFAWNKTGCENCHLPNVPIRKDAFGGDLPEHIAQNNQRCNGMCHAVTDHFASRTKNEILVAESCSTCHREHLGLDRSLVDVSDDNCSRCHANMPSVAIAQTGKSPASVSNFSNTKEHPEFVSLERDLGTILFSHIQHMRPGQPITAGGKEAKRLEMLQDKFRSLYQDRVDATGLIQLRCSDCHSRDVELKGYEALESSQSPSMAAVQSSTHMLYKPIEFDKHCVACHDLDGLPHGLDRAQTNQAIDSILPLRQLEFFRNRLNEIEIGSRTSPAIEKQITDREQRLQAILGDSASLCSKCHQNAPKDSASIVEPSHLNKRWLRNASFPHGAHLMVSCNECHSKAFDVSTDPIDSRAEASQVMIPGIQSCRTCHIQDAEERSHAFAKNKHVASADCVDCHRYHVDPPKSIAGASVSSLGEVHRFLTNEASP